MMPPLLAGELRLACLEIEAQNGHCTVTNLLRSLVLFVYLDCAVISLFWANEFLQYHSFYTKNALPSNLFLSRLMIELDRDWCAMT